MGAVSVPGSPRRVLHDAVSISSVSDERLRSGDDAATNSSASGSSGVGGIIGVDAVVAASFSTPHHPAPRHAFPNVVSDDLRALREKYLVGKAVGKGGYSVVYKGRRVCDGTAVAVKRVDLRGMPDKKRERCLREVQLLGNVRHGNVVTMLDSFLDSKFLVIVFEWASGGDLKRFIKKRRDANKPLDEPETWTVFSQIVDALAHLHRRDVGVAHRDVKPANVLVVNGVVKLADLGLGKRIAPSRENLETDFDGNGDGDARNKTMRSKVGTPYYVAPEIVRGDPYGLASDVWSLGCLLYELSTLRSPFEMLGPGANVKHVFKRIGTNQYAPLVENGKLSPVLVELTSAMLQTDPSKRPTMQDIKRTCDAAVRAFAMVDHEGQTRGVYAAAELVCDRLCYLSVKTREWDVKSAPKNGTLESALGQPGVFVEPAAFETDAVRFTRLAKLCAWLLPLAQGEDTRAQTLLLVSELAAALEAYACSAEPGDETVGETTKEVTTGVTTALSSLPPTPPKGPPPPPLTKSSPRRARDAGAKERVSFNGEEKRASVPLQSISVVPAAAETFPEKESAPELKKAKAAPPPPLAALRSYSLTTPTEDELVCFALASRLADAARACVGADANVARKLQFASAAAVARGHGWAAVTVLSTLCECAFRRVGSSTQAVGVLEVLEKNKQSPRKQTPTKKWSPRKPKLEKFPSPSQSKRSPIGAVKKSPEPNLVEEEPHVKTVSLSPEVGIENAETRLVSPAPVKKSASRAMRAAAAARARLAARNSWQRVFDAGQVEVKKIVIS